jgi:lipid-binding SYLF domain-containing protein
LQVKGGKEIAGKAKGVLVLPGVIKAGLIVGGEYGEGALRVGGKTVSYYDISLKGAKLTKIEKKD